MKYIKKFIPELEKLTAKQIHDWEKRQVDGIAYPAPIIDHAEARKETLKRYGKTRGK